MAGEKYLIELATGLLPANAASADVSVRIHRDDAGTFANLTPGAVGTARNFLRADEFTTQTVTDVPAAFVDANWSVATGAATGNRLDVTIATLPASNGSTITNIEYDLDASGTWVSSGGTGSFTIVAPAPDTSYSVRLRAVNANGAGTAGNAEAATSSAAAGFDPATLFTAGRDGFWVAPSLTTSFESADSSDPAEVADGVQFQLDSSGLAVPRNLSQGTSGQRPTLQLDGSDYLLRFARASSQSLRTALYSPVNASNGVSIFARVKFNALDVGNIIAADFAGARLWQFKVQPTGALEGTGFRTGSTITTGLTATGLVTTGTWYNVCMVWNTTNLRVWIGSMLDADADLTVANSSGTVHTGTERVWIGARGDAEEPSDIDVKYGFVGNWSLSEAERLNLVTAVGGA